jgi:hypothetical protein
VEVSVNLTSEQIRAIRDGEAVSIFLPEVGEECVIVRRDVFERLKQAMEDDLPTSRSISRMIEEIDPTDP